MPTHSPAKASKALLFARNFFKHPRMLGSLIPSSRFLVSHMVRRIDWKKTETLVEYGPGVGTVTVELLRRLKPDARLVVIEMNPEFVRYLERSFKDPRLHVVHGSAADVAGILQRIGIARADCILSGIPYTVMPPFVRMAILQNSHDVLAPDGQFIVFQFTGAVFPDLKRVFGEVRRAFEPRNLPPARIFVCRCRNGDGAHPDPLA